MAYILFWKRIENRRILLPRWTFGNSIFYKSVIKDVKIFFRMKKTNCSLYETSILDVDLCVEFARGFRYLDDLKTFFEIIWNVCSLTTSSLVSIKVVWNLTFRRPLLYRIQPPLRLRQSPPPDRPQQWKRRETYCLLISWFFIWLWMAYYGDNTIAKLVVFPIISFFLVIKKNRKLSITKLKQIDIWVSN